MWDFGLNPVRAELQSGLQIGCQEQFQDSKDLFSPTGHRCGQLENRTLIRGGTLLFLPVRPISFLAEVGFPQNNLIKRGSAYLTQRMEVP